VVRDVTGLKSSSIPVEYIRRDQQARRADAVRNRQRVLEVARDLVAANGLEAMTMDDIASAAGVGKGTVYRAVGSRAGLAEALLDDAERRLQQRVLTGRPPLGPGGDARSRLNAFVTAYVQLLEDNAELLVETEKGRAGARFHTGAYAFWHWHVTALLDRLQHSRPGLVAHIMLSTLAADLYRHLRHDQGASPAAIRTAVNTVVAGLMPASTRAVSRSSG
jgi:AcrR family transcriptional regulator